MTIYIPAWLYWYGGLPLALIIGYLLGRLHKSATVPPADVLIRERDAGARWCPVPQYDEATARACETARSGNVETPTTKRGGTEGKPCGADCEKCADERGES